MMGGDRPYLVSLAVGAFLRYMNTIRITVLK
jgi:hypothetical protein